MQNLIVFVVFQIRLNGCIELEEPEKLLEEINQLIEKYNGSTLGQFAVYQLPPYVDYQKCDE